MSGEPTQTGWVIEKKLQVAHFLTTLALVVSAVMYVADLEKRVSILEATKAEQVIKDASQDANTRDRWNEMNQKLERIDTKLDRLVERGAR